VGALSKGGTRCGDVVDQKHRFPSDLSRCHRKRAHHSLSAMLNGDALDLDVIDRRHDRIGFVAKAERVVQ